ncbi:MAG: flagellar basal-body MS-ring/collar protein FliF [Thermoanaerobacteraceae bacterium]
MPDYLKTLKEQANNFWNKFERKQKIQIGIIAILLIGSISLLVYILNKPNYEVLYTDLNAKDAGVVVDKLKNEFKIPYELSNNGSTILIPSQYKDEVRMKLATEGIPQGGFSFQDAMNNSLATTDQERRQKYLYFVQNEIRNSLKTIDGVQDAVVNIVVPDQNNLVLSNSSNSATAAVMLTLKNNVTLSAVQINGIIDFVAKSVEGLKPENVTLIDSNGKILTAQVDSNLESADTQFKMQNKVQQDLQNSIQTLLEQVFGPGNVAVRTNVILDFDKKTEDRIEYQPVQGNDNKGIIRSVQDLKEKATGTNSQTSVGQSSNNPPVNPSGSNGTSDYNKSETTINYEINQIKTSLVSAQGKISNISVAVVVNKNLNDSMKQQISDLVTNAAGGKLVTVSVQGIQFNQDLLKQMQAKTKTQSTILPYLLSGILAALLLGGIIAVVAIRKKKKDIQVSPEEEALSMIEQIEEIDIDASEKDEKKKQIEKFIKQKPEIVAQLIRTWLNEE